MLTQEKSMRIGEVAKASGLPIKTIRYYDELGLLKTSGRTKSNYRLFGPEVLGRLRFIKRAQSLGLSLVEIKEFLTVHDQGNLPCSQIRTKLEDKLNEIEQQIQQLQILKQELGGLLSGWQAMPTASAETICPIIEQSQVRKTHHS
ncbi:heavy metal-responsive transcriptional regulator [Thermoleptolyngbya sp. M55_K2018_002]|uniref:heavy metal-responsive transcriptional regulator n=1 Tax=Thermoleptolyngbya sp. M55_K2018_002 TaxID=2747808 RepID=UPI0019D8028D|nr:heavy metal-responsive transcriptional regulator [Thermoleptolyngbya sp. M55_K2018_002]HIK39338.1 heavy metal-responsive transcriptional regulator [Thermoleptolyngbya sp. M55_K2018_002]